MGQLVGLSVQFSISQMLVFKHYRNRLRTLLCLFLEKLMNAYFSFGYARCVWFHPTICLHSASLKNSNPDKCCPGFSTKPSNTRSKCLAIRPIVPLSNKSVL